MQLITCKVITVKQFNIALAMGYDNYEGENNT
jgi:hypothetical protein